MVNEIECKKCGIVEYERSISEPIRDICPVCNKKASPLISRTNFVLKGSGGAADRYTLDSEKPHDEGVYGISTDNGKTWDRPGSDKFDTFEKYGEIDE